MASVVDSVPSLIPLRSSQNGGSPSGFLPSILKLARTVRSFFAGTHAQEKDVLEGCLGEVWLSLANNGWGASAQFSRQFSKQFLDLGSFPPDHLSQLDGAQRFLCGQLLKLIYLKSSLSISTFEMQSRTELFEDRLKAAASSSELNPQTDLFREISVQSLELETDLKRFEIIQMAALNLSKELQRLAEDTALLSKQPGSDANTLQAKRNKRLKDLESSLDRIHLLFGRSLMSGSK